MFFREVIGQNDAKERLINSVQQNRVSHAMMFWERGGSGALPLALAYSKYLLCQNPQETDACGSCASCVKFTSLTHPDLHFFFPIILSGMANSKGNTTNYHLKLWNETILERPYLNLEHWQEKLGNTQKKAVISVNQSHEIIKKISLKSFEGGYKIMIIWMAEMFNNQASNKLLKVLEEPPEKTVFILITQKTEQIISTIISRTQLIKLKKLSNQEIATQLVSKDGIDEASALEIAKTSSGNYGVALHQTKHQYENASFELFINWMRLCYKKDVLRLVDWSNQTASLGREEQKQFLHFALNIMRQSVVQNYVGEQQVLLPQNEHNFLKKFSVFITGDNVLELVKTMNDSIYHIDRNANSKILFLDLSLTIAKLI